MPHYIVRKATAADLPGVRRMIEEYVVWIGLDLAFQGIDEELAGLPGEYAPPDGALLVAAAGNALGGMVGIRLFEGGVCEMKRLFVRPAARNQGIARRLVDAAIAEARLIGYDEMRLDTLPIMGDAQSLYVAMGFRDINAYYDTPIAGTRFMAKAL